VVGDEMMLNLSQACVGVEAKDEWNVVDVETFSRTGDRVQHTLLQLRGDHMPHVRKNGLQLFCLNKNKKCNVKCGSR
jgi:hypothetical protein